MNLSKLRRFLPLFALLVIALAVAALPVMAQTRREVKVQILAVNDFHGNLAPPSGSSGRVTIAPGVTVDAGGVEYLSTHVNALR